MSKTLRKVVRANRLKTKGKCCCGGSSAQPACYADGEEVWSKWDYGNHWLINNESFGIEVPKYVGDAMAEKIYDALRVIWVDRDA